MLIYHRVDVSMYLRSVYQQASWFYQLMAAWGMNASHDRHDQQEPKSQVDISQPTGQKVSNRLENKQDCSLIFYQNISVYTQICKYIYIYRLSCCVVLPYLTLYTYITLH